MKKISFVTYRQIERAADEHFKKYRTKSDFPSLVNYLFHQNHFLCKIPDIPLGTTWSQINDTSFFQVLLNLPVTKSFLLLPFSQEELRGKQIPAEKIIPEDMDAYAIPYVRSIAERMHTHNFFEINYVFSGTCYMVFENEKKSLATGDLCIIAPGSRHDITFDDDTIAVSLMIRQNTFERTFFKLLAQEDLMASFFRNILYANTKSANYMFFSTGTDNADVKNTIKDIFMECYDTDIYSNACVTSRIHLLFALLLRRFSHTIQIYDTEKSMERRSDFTQVLLYIQKNFSTITLHSLAETFHYNPSYLSSMIKKNTGRNLSDIIIDLRMSKASDLLKNTHLKVTEIAALVGYDSVDHFSRLFKRTYKMSPGKYARENGRQEG